MKNLAWVTALSPPAVLGHCSLVTLDTALWVTRLLFSWVTVPPFFLPSPGVTDLPSSLFSYGHCSLIALNYPRSELFPSTLISWVNGLYFLSCMGHSRSFRHLFLITLIPVVGHCSLLPSPSAGHSTRSLLFCPSLYFALLSWFTLLLSPVLGHCPSYSVSLLSACTLLSRAPTLSFPSHVPVTSLSHACPFLGH